MRRLRRFALAAVVLDALCGVGALLFAGRATEAREAPPATEAPGVAVRYHATDAGCAVIYEVAEGVWRYGGPTHEAACAEVGS